MTEAFLHYLWKYRLLKPELRLISGENCEILEVGLHNSNAGPDFFNARIRIGDTIWAGNIEIHIKTSDWFLHKHHLDKAYENVILHVVWQHDKVIIGKNGQPLPSLEIKDAYPSEIFERYTDFMSNKSWIACENSIRQVDRFVVNNWLDRLMIERLEDKAHEIESQLHFNKNNWEQTFYEFLAQNFGFKINALPFDLLAKSLPLNYLDKHKNSKHQIEALLFGQAGFLHNHFKDDYPKKLITEYRFLREKYKLVPLDPHIWRFMRLRPSNFPTIRIAQFAALVYQSSHLFSKLISIESIKQFSQLFEVNVSDYWTSHFHFDKKSPNQTKRLGKTAIHLIAINTLIPFLFVYGKSRNDQSLIERSIKLLEQLPGENNGIIRKWENLGLSTRTAFNTQALIQLKTCYCNHKKCLDCSIGNNLFRSDLNLK